MSRPAASTPEPVADGVSQRLRVGALGLAAVFLLVMLATALLHVTADGDLANRSAPTNAAEPAEPLAQLGVAPGNPGSEQGAVSPAAGGRPR